MTGRRPLQVVVTFGEVTKTYRAQVALTKANPATVVSAGE
jgi:hypothetical protein